MNVDMNAVVDFYNHYQVKSVSNPDLYVSGETSVNVILPNALLEFANAAAGHSGFGAGARARGIRKQVNNSRVAIKEIFATPESLAEFILSSECNADAYVDSVKARHLGSNYKPSKYVSIRTDDRKVDKCFSEILSKYDIKSLAVKFGKETILKARKCLTVNEFELRFGLVVA
jgi:hypothetical protein